MSDYEINEPSDTSDLHVVTVGGRKIGGVRPNGERWEARTIDKAMAMDGAAPPLFDTREQAARHVFEHVMGDG